MHRGRAVLAGVLCLPACSEGLVDPVETDVGEAEACADVRTWERNWTERERELVAAINGARGAGQTCVAGEIVDPRRGLLDTPELRCMARLHADYMSGENSLREEGRGGLGLGGRAVEAGFGGIVVAEIRAADSSDPEVFAADILRPGTETCGLVNGSGPDRVGVGLYREDVDGQAWWSVVVAVGE